MHAYTPANNTFDGPITNLLSMLCILVEILSPAQAKREKSLNDFKFGNSVDRFPSDSAGSTAVKGLNTIIPIVAYLGHTVFVSLF